MARSGTVRNRSREDVTVQCFCGVVHDLGRRGFLGALMATAVAAQASAPESAGPADPALIEDLVAANRILYDQGVVDGFGQSARATTRTRTVA
jgi:hypothetical protein